MANLLVNSSLVYSSTSYYIYYKKVMNKTAKTRKLAA